jgi:hypothetical protein
MHETQKIDSVTPSAARQHRSVPLCCVAVVVAWPVWSASTQPLAFCNWMILMYTSAPSFFLTRTPKGQPLLLYPASRKNEAHHGNRGQARCSPLVTDVGSADPLASPCGCTSFALGIGITSARSGNVRTSASSNSFR